MPIKPSAVSVAGFSIASAAPNADMVMPTATQRTVDPAAMFAQILDSLDSLSGSAGQSPSVPVPAARVGAHRVSEPVSSNPSSGASRKPIKLHQAPESPAPTPASALTTSGIGVLDPAFNYAIVPVIAAADLKSQATETVSPLRLLADAPQALRSSDHTAVLQTAAMDVVSSSPSPSLPFRSEDTPSDVPVRGATESAGAPVQTAIGAVGLPPSMSSTSSLASYAEQSRGIAANNATSSTLPTVATSSELASGSAADTARVAATTLASDGADRVAPRVPSVLPSMANTKFPAAEPQNAGVPIASAAAANSSDRASAAIGFTRTTSTAVAPPSPLPAPAPLPYDEQTRDVRDPENERPKVWAPGRINPNMPAARTEPVIFSPPVKSVQITRDAVAGTEASPSMASMNSVAPVPAAVNSTHVTQSVLPTSASPAAINSDAENLAASFLDASKPRIPATSTPNAAPRVETTSSAPISERSATNTSAPSSASVPQFSDGSVTTDTSSAPETLVPTDITIPAAVSTIQSMSAPTSPEPVQTAQSTIHAWTAQAEQAVAVAIPAPRFDHSDNPKQTAAQSIPFVSEPRVSSTQVVPSAVATSAFAANARSQKPREGSAAAKVVRDFSTEALAASPRQLQTPEAISANAPRVPRVSASASPSPAIPMNTDVDNLVRSSDTAAPQTSSQDPAPALTAVLGSDWTASIQPDTTSSPAPMTTSTAADTQGQTSARASHADSNPANVGNAPTASIFSASDAPAAAQAASTIAASGSKPDLNLSTPSSTSENHTSSSNDAPLPAAPLVQKATETTELSAGLQAWNGGDNAQTRLVQAAHLGGNIRESEMNIALQADALGPIELRTRVTGDVVGAAISVERHDAHAAISSDLPALHQALHDRQLRLGDVSVVQGSLHSGASAGDGRPSQQRESSSQRPAAPGWTAAQNSTIPEIATFTESQDAGQLFDSNGRLSVRA